jgi:hypothetical protein
MQIMVHECKHIVLYVDKQIALLNCKQIMPHDYNRIMLHK